MWIKYTITHEKHLYKIITFAPMAIICSNLIIFFLLELLDTTLNFHAKILPKALLYEHGTD